VPYACMPGAEFRMPGVARMSAAAAGHAGAIPRRDGRNGHGGAGPSWRASRPCADPYGGNRLSSDAAVPQRFLLAPHLLPDAGLPGADAFLPGAHAVLPSADGYMSHYAGMPRADACMSDPDACLSNSDRGLWTWPRSGTGVRRGRADGRRSARSPAAIPGLAFSVLPVVLPALHQPATPMHAGMPHVAPTRS